MQKIGRYSVIEILGQGSMGVVYKAYDELLERPVALKTLAAAVRNSESSRKRFYQEAQLSSRLKHPHIVNVYDVGESSEGIYIAMELLEGQDLRANMSRACGQSLTQKLDWMIELSDALAFAHSHGVVHCDIKPGNVFIRSTGHSLITDFGISRLALESVAGLPVHGTPEYLSPEQLLRVHADQRADVFALGLIFYELLTAVHPFRAADASTTIHNILNSMAVPPATLKPLLPAALNDIVLSCLEKDINRRYSSSKLIHADLLRIRQAID